MKIRFKFIAVSMILLASILLGACSFGHSADESTSADSTTADTSASGPASEVLEADVDGIQMRYAVIGNGDKTMIMLPGLTAGHVTDSASSVAQEYASFANDFTIYLFDIEENVPEGYTLQQLAADTYTVIKSLGLSDFYIFGASLGGMMAICIDADHPDDVEKMLLSSTSCAADEHFNEIIEEWIGVAETGDGVKLEEVVGETIYSKTTMETSAAALSAAGAELTSYNLKQFVCTASTLLSFDILEEAGKMKTETYLVWSRGDQVILHDAFMDLARNINTGYMHIYDDSYGHAVYDEAPDFCEKMLDFFLAS